MRDMWRWVKVNISLVPWLWQTSTPSQRAAYCLGAFMLLYLVVVMIVATVSVLKKIAEKK